jgi:SET domain-containing protein
VTDDFEIRDAADRGRGLFARRPFRAGESVIEMAGIVLTTAELTDDLMALQTGEDTWLCSAGTNLDDYANHSCQPNSGYVDGDLKLVALREIAAGEEITWDYSTSLDEPGWSLDCRCGYPSCRGVVLPWRELTDNVRERLRPIALAYLRHR